MKRDSKIRKTALILSAAMVFGAMGTSMGALSTFAAANGPGETGIPEDKKVRDVTKKERRRMTEVMKNWTMHIAGVRGFEEAIVTRGGVSVKEISPTTMESKLVKGLYFAGEVTDYDGPCGGFNLNNAWVTGIRAGRSAVKECSAEGE